MKMKDTETLQYIGMQFNESISRIKHCQPLWADLLKKSTVFHDRLRLMSNGYSEYLDCVQKIVDVAQCQEGGAKDLAPILSKMYVKQRTMEGKLEKLCKLISEGYNLPMKEKLKEWKETCDYLDNKHSKEGKRRLEEVKKAVVEAEKLKKKVMKKGKTKKQGQLSDAERSKESMLYSLQQFEQHALRGALIEERAHYCTFVHMMVPAWELECELMDDGTHVREVMAQAIQVSSLPTKLPSDAEKCIHKIRLVASDTTFEASEVSNIPHSTTAHFEQGAISPRTSFISTNSSSTSGVSSGGSFGTLPNSPKDPEKGSSTYKYSSTQFSSFDSLARSYPASDQTSAYGSSPSVCQTARGIVADINKFVEQTQDDNDTTIVAPSSTEKGVRKRGSGDYYSLSPILNRHSFEGETYENLGPTDIITHDGCIDLDKITDPRTQLKSPSESPSEDKKMSNQSLAAEEEPLYENIADQIPIESIYDVPPQPPPVRSASLVCRRSSANDLREHRESTVNAYLERRRSILSQNRSNTDLRSSNEYLHSSRHSLTHQPTYYTSSRPASVCSNHSNHGNTNNHGNTVNNHAYTANNHSNMNNNHSNMNNNHSNNNNYFNSNGSINGPYSVQQFAQPQQYAQRSECFNRTAENPGYASRAEIQQNGNYNGGYVIQNHVYAAQQHGTQNTGNYAAAQQHGTQNTGNYATAQHGTQNTGNYAAAHKGSSINRSDSAHYSIQQRRSDSRLSLKSQPTHYATMSARPNKRTYSLTSLNQQYNSSQSLHNSTHSLNDGNNNKILSAVDPDMPPPPPPEVGKEISNLCQQITKGGTLRPSQMRMMGMKQGDTSTIKRRDVMSSINSDMPHLNLNK